MVQHRRHKIVKKTPRVNSCPPRTCSGRGQNRDQVSGLHCNSQSAKTRSWQPEPQNIVYLFFFLLFFITTKINVRKPHESHPEITCAQPIVNFCRFQTEGTKLRSLRNASAQTQAPTTPPKKPETQCQNGRVPPPIDASRDQILSHESRKSVQLVVSTAYTNMYMCPSPRVFECFCFFETMGVKSSFAMRFQCLRLESGFCGLTLEFVWALCSQFHDKGSEPSSTRISRSAV